MEDRQPATRAQELRSFVFLSVVMAPVMAAIIVGGLRLSRAPAPGQNGP
jgi:nitrate reductase NapE component